MDTHPFLNPESFVILFCISVFSCRPVPVVRPGAGGCLLYFRWRIGPSSPSCLWPPSRTASLPSAEFSSLLRARGRGDWPAAPETARAAMQFSSSSVHLTDSWIHLYMASLIHLHLPSLTSVCSLRCSWTPSCVLQPFWAHMSVLWERWAACMQALLVSLLSVCSSNPPSSPLDEWSYNTSLNEWPLTSSSLSRRR